MSAKISIDDRAKNLWKVLFDMGVIRDDVDYMVAGLGEIRRAILVAWWDGAETEAEAWNDELLQEGVSTWNT